VQFVLAIGAKTPARQFFIMFEPVNYAIQKTANNQAKNKYKNIKNIFSIHLNYSTILNDNYK